MRIPGLEKCKTWGPWSRRADGETDSWLNCQSFVPYYLVTLIRDGTNWNPFREMERPRIKRVDVLSLLIETTLLNPYSGTKYLTSYERSIPPTTVTRCLQGDRKEGWHRLEDQGRSFGTLGKPFLGPLSEPLRWFVPESRGHAGGFGSLILRVQTTTKVDDPEIRRRPKLRCDTVDMTPVDRHHLTREGSGRG